MWTREFRLAGDLGDNASRDRQGTGGLHPGKQSVIGDFPHLLGPGTVGKAEGEL